MNERLFPQGGKKVIGMGSACLDYLAQVAAWPNPDDKLRTESLEVRKLNSLAPRAGSKPA